MSILGLESIFVNMFFRVFKQQDDPAQSAGSSVNLLLFCFRAVAVSGARASRAAAGIVATGLPLFAAGIVPNSPAANGPGVVGAPVTVGGVPVRPGDIVVGDADGVVVIPLDQAGAVLERLAAIRVAEAQAIARVEAGATDTDRIRAIMEAARIIGP